MTASFSIEFQAIEIPKNIIERFHSTVGKLTSVDQSEAVQSELKLKQLFLDIDKDNSGQISQSELIEAMGRQKKLNDNTLRDILKNIPTDGDEEQSDENKISHLFNYLDITGDGQISWWEWQCIIHACKYKKNVSPFLVLSHAASAALRNAEKTKDQNLQNYSKANNPVDNDIYKGGNHFGSSQYVSKLQSTIQLLRQENTMLEEKIQYAIRNANSYHGTKKSLDVSEGANFDIPSGSITQKILHTTMSKLEELNSKPQKKRTS